MGCQTSRHSRTTAATEAESKNHNNRTVATAAAPPHPSAITTPATTTTHATTTGSNEKPPNPRAAASDKETLQAAPANSTRLAPSNSTQLLGDNDELNSENSNGKTEEPPFIHLGKICDGCLAQPIRGKRFCSVSLPGMDFCETCKEQYSDETVVFRDEITEFDVANQEAIQAYYKTCTKFDLWKSARETVNGGKTTLEQQIDLASRLWDESSPTAGETGHTTTSSAMIIEALKKTPIKGSDSLVSWKGFRVGWFLEVFCKTPYMQKLIDFGCELWFVRKVCIIEIIRQAHCSKYGNPSNEVPVLSDPFVDVVGTILGGFGLEGNADGIVKPPTTFISYTGGYTLNDTLEVLQQLDPNEYVWMDIFCVNQFAWTGKSRSLEMQKFKETFLDDLQDRIKEIGKTALILEKWDDVMRTLEQIWVLWEIFNTADAGANLEVLLPHGQTQDFVANCLESREKFETIMASLATVDANKARAEDDDDRARIFARIQESGVSKVNNLATSAMRGWMQKQGMGRLEEQRKGGGEGPNSVFLNNLAKLLKDQGKLEEAEPLYREALEMDLKLLGPDHPSTLTSINDLAALLYTQGKLEEAEPLYHQALEKRQKVLGPDHPGTLTSLNNLAALLDDQGKIEEAAPLYRQALEKQQKVLGPDHPDTLTSINNLAELLRAQGKLDEAEPLFRQASEKSQDILGPDHPDTLISINNLAMLLQDQGKLQEADPLLRQASEKRQKVLGPDHPSTLSTLNNLAGLLRTQGKLDEAEPLLRQALGKRQKVLGPDHPHTLRSINDLALLLKSQGKLDEAEPLYQQALEKQQKVLGPDHPNTLTSMYNLANLLYNKGDTAEAKILLRDCLEKSLRVLGQDHPDTINRQQAWNYWFGGTDSS